MLSILKGIFSGSNESLKEILLKDPILIDVRSVPEFERGSVRGAVNIPLNEIANKQKSLDHNKEYIVFCQSGNRSGQALQILKKLGFKNIHNGGGWQSLKDIVK